MARTIWLLLTLVVLAGCDNTSAEPRVISPNAIEPAADTPDTLPPPVVTPASGTAVEASDEAEVPSAAKPPESNPPAPDSRVSEETAPADLGTRKQGVDWPIFLGPTGDSKSPETGILTDWSGDKLKIVWQKPLGTSYGIGAVSRGRYFQFDRIDDRAARRGAAGTAVLTCLNAESGEELWRFEYPTDYVDMYGYNGGPRCSPLVDGNRVYIFGAKGMLHCLSADKGDLLWKVDTTAEYGVVQNFFGVGSNPVIEGDLLIVMVGGSTPDSRNVPPGQLDLVEPNGTAIVAFDKFTGEEKYRTGDELASYSSLKTATIEGRRWCFAFCRGGLLGFEPATGKIDFHYPWRAKVLESVNASVPVVVGEEVFISETYGPGSSLLKVSPGAHEVVWQDDSSRRARAMQTHWNTPIAIDGYLYGCSGRNPPDAQLRCIDWNTGEVMWNLEGEPSRERTSLLYVDGHFVCLGEYGKLQLIKVNPQKPEVISEVVLRRDAEGLDPVDGGEPRLLHYPCWAAPILSHGLLYVRGDDRLVCLELIPQE